MNQSSTPIGLVLSGIDGSNLLGFLAALGALRTLGESWPDREVALAWQVDAAWRPVVYSDPPTDRGELVAALAERLAMMQDDPALTIDRDLKIAPDRFRAYALEAVGHAHQTGDRRWADFVAAFGSEVTIENDVIQDTDFRTMSGAGHQHFLEFMRKLVEETTAQDIDRALFEAWTYEDPGPSMRWDPEDDRRYALRWNDPSGDKITTVRGANRLAIEALPLFPTAPRSDGLATTGFRGKGSRDTFLTWPIWMTPASVDVVRTLLGLASLQQEDIPRNDLAAMGIVEVYRSQRLTVGKYRNFTPASPA